MSSIYDYFLFGALIGIGIGSIAGLIVSIIIVFFFL